MSLNLTMKVAGVTYEGRQAKIARLRGDEAVRIIPEPTNAYDPHALAVHVAMSDGSIAHVGYVPRELAARIAPLLDGEAIAVSIEHITGGFEKYDGSIASFGLLLRVALEGDTALPETDDPPF